MIIKYKFQDGFISEIEVDDELGGEISEMNAHDRKIDRRETRRHTYLSDMHSDNLDISDDFDILDAIIEADERQRLHKRLMAAIATLEPQQRDLIIRVYWRGEKRKDIAKIYGISERSVGRHLQKVLCILHNLLK